MTGIIAFCGSKGAGKSTASSIFETKYAGAIEEVALAGHLKDACARVFNVDIDLFLNPHKKEVELDTYIVLNKDNLTALYKEFDVDNFSFDAHIRPHIGMICRTPRKLLQYIGTEVLHPIDPLIHVKKMLSKRNPNMLTLITDLRFVNEFNYLTDTFADKFVPVYVKNSRAELAAETDPHPSERELLLFKDRCKLMPNEASLGELDRQIAKLIVGL